MSSRACVPHDTRSLPRVQQTSAAFRGVRDPALLAKALGPVSETRRTNPNLRPRGVKNGVKSHVACTALGPTPHSMAALGGQPSPAMSTDHGLVTVTLGFNLMSSFFKFGISTIPSDTGQNGLGVGAAHQHVISHWVSSRARHLRPRRRELSSTAVTLSTQSLSHRKGAQR